jgi:hypothetical protein
VLKCRLLLDYSYILAEKRRYCGVLCFYNTIIDTAVRIYVASVLCIFKSNKTLMLELLIENSGMRNIVF